MRNVEYPDLEALLRPKSVVVAWASDDTAKLGGLALKYLIQHGYHGKVFPINPNRSEVQGIKSYASIREIPQDIDTAILVMRAPDVGPVLRQCAEKGAKAAVVPVIGFSEVGGDGEKAEKEIEEICKAYGIRICGPNTNGLLNLIDGIALGYSPAMERVVQGNLGFVTQSGALISGLVPRLVDQGIGLSYFIAAGNQLNVEVCDYVKYLIDDPHTEVIAMYAEGFQDPDKLLNIADLALGKGKPLIVMKIGRSELAAKTALSHTASLVGSDKVFDGICKQKGIIRVADFDSLTHVCSAFINCGLPKGDGVGVLSTSGAATGVIADHAMNRGLRFPELSEETRQEALKILPGWPASREIKNLWDIAAALPGRMTDLSKPTIELFAQDKNFDMILTIFSGVERASAIAVSSAVVDASKVVGKPFVLLHARGSLRDFETEIFAESNIPIVYSAANAVEVMAALIKYNDNLKICRETREFGPQVTVNVKEVKERLNSAGKALTEHESKELLSLYGIRITEEAIAQSPEEAVHVAQKIGYPVALKVNSPQIIHKTDASAMKLNIRNEIELSAAYHEIMVNSKKYDPQAEIQGILVQEMVKEGKEVIIGMSQDPQFGPAILFGLGGVAVEVLEDTSLRVAPLTRRDAEDMVSEVKAYKMLQAFRGKPEADVHDIIDTLLRISRLSEDLKDVILEIDVNPLMVFDKGKGVKVVDALVVLKR